jgi:hypothetical protein
MSAEFLSDKTLALIRNEATQAAVQAKDELSKIHALLIAANVLYQHLPLDTKDAINEFFDCDCSLGHHLLHGENAVEDLLNLTVAEETE